MKYLHLVPAILIGTILATGLATENGIAQAHPNTHLTPERLAEIRILMDAGD